jgi:hypothetical protein
MATNTNQVLLGSTIPLCTYTDNKQVSAVYTDERVYYLLTEDQYIRTQGKKDLNMAGLRTGLEAPVAELASRLVPEGFGLLIVVDDPGQNGFGILVPSKGGAPLLEVNPLDDTVIKILGTKDRTAYHVSSEYQQRSGELCTITVALFKTGSYDVTGIQGAGI